MGNIKYSYMYADNESVKPCNAVKVMFNPVSYTASFIYYVFSVFNGLQVWIHICRSIRALQTGENLVGGKKKLRQRNVSMQITRRRVQTGELGQLVCYPSKTMQCDCGKETGTRRFVARLSLTSWLFFFARLDLHLSSQGVKPDNARG